MAADQRSHRAISQQSSIEVIRRHHQWQVRTQVSSKSTILSRIYQQLLSILDIYVSTYQHHEKRNELHPSQGRYIHWGQ